MEKPRDPSSNNPMLESLDALKTGDDGFDHFTSEKEFATFLVAAFNGSPDCVTITERETREIVAINDNAQRKLGLTAKEVRNQSAFDFVKWTSPEAYDRFIKNLYSKQRSGIMEVEIYNSVLNKYSRGNVSSSQFRFKGRIYTCSSFQELPENHFISGQTSSETITWRDVENLIDYSGSVIIRWRDSAGINEDGEVQNLEYISENVNRWGYSQDELLEYKVRFDDLIHPDDREQVILQARAYCANKELSTYMLNYRILRTDGCYIYVESKNWIKRKSTGEIIYILSLINDVTYKTKIEKEFIKNQNIESLGVLAGGIAHDFNNLLTSLAGRISMLKFNLNNPEKSLKLINNAEATLEQAKELTQQILTFSKGGDPIKKCVDLNKFVRDRVSLCLLGSGVKATFEMADNVECVKIDESQFGQVINNIVLNAVSAMEGEGLLVIGLETLKLQDAGEYREFIKLSLRDYGPGIPDFIKDKIFEPYFSTKSHGTGLGLAITKSIVERHDGKIEVESNLGTGTTFNIYLPEGTFTACELADSEANALGNKVKTSVLVMDDDEMVRGFMCEALEDMGCEVHGAASGEEAILLYQSLMKTSKAPDVVIMDLTIPGGMGGKEAVQKIKQLDADVNAIVSSGYSVDPVMANYQDYGFNGVLTKPFTMDQLGEAIKYALPDRDFI